MLKQRILTAMILIPLFIFFVLKLSPPAFGILTALVVIWGAAEWSSLMEVQQFPKNLIYPILMVFVLWTMLFVPILYVLYSALVGWLIAAVLVLRYPDLASVWGKGVVLRGFMGIIVLVPCWLAVNFIRNADNGTYILLFLFILIWGADSGAYFIGKKWGKSKLAKSVSPGKSWQGLLGALMTTSIIALISLYGFHIPYRIWLPALVLSFITVLFSVLGDLFESMLKRNAGLKDSGHLLPGHGGILDRIDSLTAAAPIFALGALWLGEIYR